MRTKMLVIIGLFSAASGFSDTGIAGKILEIRFESHRFSPLSLVVPAGTPLQVRVINLSQERIEFESFSLNREKIVNPGESVTLKLPALRAGSYDFFDDFHPDVPEGRIVAR
jgi:hypothetical protein